MKRLLPLSLILVPFLAFADPWDSAKSKNAGNYTETYATTITTYTATKVIDSSVAIKSAVIDFFNNSAYTVWVGTNTTTLQTTGFPIRSSTTYTTDGTFTGDLYSVADSSAGGSVNSRTIYWMKNDAVR